jgi:hypothetical protein
VVIRSPPPILFGLALYRRRLQVLHLEQIGRAAGPVKRALALGHDAFEPELAGVANTTSPSPCLLARRMRSDKSA